MNDDRDLRDLRGERLTLLARYDHHLPPPIWARIREIEIELAWAQHRQAAAYVPQNPLI
jgi:hypothetical protein